MPKTVAVGVVTKAKQDKTRRVEIPRLVKHPKYGKYIKRKTFATSTMRTTNRAKATRSRSSSRSRARRPNAGSCSACEQEYGGRCGRAASRSQVGCTK